MDACSCMVGDECQIPMNDLTCVSDDSSDSEGEQRVPFQEITP